DTAGYDPARRSAEKAPIAASALCWPFYLPERHGYRTARRGRIAQSWYTGTIDHDRPGSGKGALAGPDSQPQAHRLRHLGAMDQAARPAARLSHVRRAAISQPA